MNEIKIFIGLYSNPCNGRWVELDEFLDDPETIILGLYGDNDHEWATMDIEGVLPFHVAEYGSLRELETLQEIYNNYEMPHILASHDRTSYELSELLTTLENGEYIPYGPFDSEGGVVLEHIELYHENLPAEFIQYAMWCHDAYFLNNDIHTFRLDLELYAIFQRGL